MGVMCLEEPRTDFAVLDQEGSLEGAGGWVLL
jgi:hypothetical protein